MTRGRLALIAVGLLGWGGLVVLGLQGLAASPPTVGFDLALLLEAGRRVATGGSPYDPAMLGGASPNAEDLFYSYPPPIAQLASRVGGLPLGIAVLGWALVAVSGVAFVAGRLARTGGLAPTDVVLASVALAPFVFPFAIAVLFGNLDAVYPLLYGNVLLAALPTSSRAMRIAGGVSVAVATIAKLHPLALAVWLLVRATADRRFWVAVVAAVTVGIVVVALSLAVGGVEPWSDYLAIVRAGAGADVVDPRNIALVSLVGQLTGLDGSALRIGQAIVALAALGVAILAARRIHDPLASVTVATVASLVVLPVTWYHYPVALIPSAIALALLRPASRPFVAAAGFLATLAIGWLPLTWLAVALLLVGVRPRGSAA